MSGASLGGCAALRRALGVELTYGPCAAAGWRRFGRFCHSKAQPMIELESCLSRQSSFWTSFQRRGQLAARGSNWRRQESRWQSNEAASFIPLSRPVLLRHRRPMLVDVTVAPAAKKRLVELAHRVPAGSDGHSSAGGYAFLMRLRVISGGCSGFQYKFSAENIVQEDDTFISVADEGDSCRCALVVDSMSAQFLRGCVVDYVEDFLSSSFQVVSNAAAIASCSCGHSFEAADS